MTEIGKSPKHKTTHQDGGDDELVLTGILPGVHKTTHQDAGADEIDASGLAGRCDFVDRGDPAAYDFGIASFTTDGAAHDLDLSAIVPSNAKAVLLKIAIEDDTTVTRFRIGKKGNTELYNSGEFWTQVANVLFGTDFICPIGADGKLTYIASNLVITTINLLVKGWWI